jgi:hypothetical protein
MPPLLRPGSASAQVRSDLLSEIINLTRGPKKLLSQPGIPNVLPLYYLIDVFFDDVAGEMLELALNRA